MSTPAAKKLRRAVKLPEWLGSKEPKVDKRLLDRLVLDFFIVQGSKSAAEAFVAETGCRVPDGVLDCIDIRMSVRDAIQRGEIVSAMEKVNGIDAKILSECRNLRFKLLKQRLIELIRQLPDDDSMLDTILTFAQQELAPFGLEQEDFLPEIEEAMTLLAFRNPHESPIAALLDVNQRSKLATEVDSAILANQNQSQVPEIFTLIKMMKWSEGRLDLKGIAFPHIIDINTGELGEPTEEECNEAVEVLSVEEPSNDERVHRIFRTNHSTMATY